MVVSVKEKNKFNRDDDTAKAPVVELVKNEQTDSKENPDLNNLQQTLLEARKNAESAKAIVTETITRVYQENHASKKRAEMLVKAFDEAMENAIENAESTNIFMSSPSHAFKKHPSTVTRSSTDSGRMGLLQRILNNGNNSLSNISDITKSFLGNSSLDLDTRKEFYNLVIKQSKHLRLLIESAVEEQASKEVEKIMERAKSEIAASQVVVSQAQREVEEAQKQTRAARDEAARAKSATQEAMNTARKQIKEAKYEIEKAHADTEEAIRLAQESVKHLQAEARAEKKTAEVVISQIKQESMSKMAEEIKAAREEVKAAREAADNAIKKSAAEIDKSRAEAKAAQNNAQVIAALAQEKTAKAAEEIKEIKKQAQIKIDSANAEMEKARENAEKAYKESREVIARAREESQKTKAEASEAIRAAEEAKSRAEENGYERFREEISRVAEEIEVTKKNALEAITRSKEESRRAIAEAEAAKSASEQAIKQAQVEILKAKEEAERARQTAMEEVVAMKEELQKYREDAETSILKANQAVTQASQDIVRQTKEEIARTRHEIELASLQSKTVPDPGEMTGTSLTSGEKDTNYIAAMLHEMRAPLHSISGFARLMLEDDVPDNMTRQEFLSIMVQQSDTLNRLLDDLTSNLATGTGRLELNRTIVSPSELINDVIQSMRNSALEKDILIGSTIPDTLPTVDADSSRIKQVLVNLIDNAIKYNEGDSTVIIKTQVMENELMILVEDHGIGIPESEMLAIFDDYYRASNHGDKEGQGLGLGICKRIVESHGGSIQVESVEGVGSTFGFTLPLAHV
jgi:signal transduction histidine kinase